MKSGGGAKGLVTMLDMAMFRENADAIRADHDRRGIPHDSIDEVIRLDEEWRKAQYDVDQLRRRRNEAARGIALSLIHISEPTRP